MKYKICFVNCSAGGSTGNIIKNLINNNSNDFDFCAILGDKADWINSNHLLSIGASSLSYKICRTETFLFGNDGFMSPIYQHKIRKFLKKEKPDIVHIHNPHRSFCNIETIFKYCHDNDVKIVWTLHDLWAFTGRCCTPLKCQLWLEGCTNCPYKNYFPRVIFNQSRKFYKKKSKLYQKLSNNLVFVAPSKWMFTRANLHNDPCQKMVINNNIDTNVFKPSAPNQDIVKSARNRFVIGAAALYFNELKGRSDIVKIAERMDKDKYFFVLIGSENKEVTYLGDNIIFIPKTFSQQDMASFYNSLDVFINPTQTDNYPTTHLESIACGTPVITYDVGGAKEMIAEGKTGFAVPLNSVNDIVKKIEFISSNKDVFSREKVSSISDFSLPKFSKQYKELYLSLLDDRSIK